jgi:hypothetical protein
MTASAKTPEPKDERAERLAAALRENLKRRKAQAREMARAKEQTKPVKRSPVERPGSLV